MITSYVGDREMVGPVTIGLGAVVGKAVFKVWFKDSEFVGSIGEGLTELVAKVIPDWQSQSAAKRQIERISEKAATSLQPLIDYDWPNIGEGQRALAVVAATSAIESFPINSITVAKAGFTPNALAEQIVDKIDKRDLTADGIELAIRLVSESAQLIIDISSSFPDFHRESYTEILAREAVIIAAVDRVFEELRRIKEVSLVQSTSADQREFEETYRRAVVRRLDRIELYGLNSSVNSSSRQHNLTTAYISLSVSGAGPVRRRPSYEIISEHFSATGRAHELTSVRVEEAAALSSKVVIKGEAGSGKTTLLQYLAVKAAKAEFIDELDDWNALIPFFISLRAVSSNNLPRPEEFVALISPVLAATMPHLWVHNQLRDGRGLILIDGLDEISEARREKTREWIEDILGTYTDCRVLVTSRPPAIPDGWLQSQHFTEIELMPMSPGDVGTFIDHWHDAVAGEERELDAAAGVRQLAMQLKERIRADRSLRELASTPLLCAMLCAMNRDRREVLPSNRIALYEAATQMILHGRDEQRKIHVADLPNLDFETKRDILQQIAFWMMQNGVSMTDQWRIVDIVNSMIPRFPRLDKSITAELLVKSLLQRSGILRSPVEEKCDFVHNAFKEYLCARAVSDGDQFGYLVAQVAGSESWREVAPMAAAITDDRRRTDFLRELLRRGDSNQSKRVMFHLLAVRCLETCTQLEPAIQDEIRSRISGLRPPNSVAEAKSLSAAGDLAGNLVQKTTGQYARSAAACVRTLRMIGTPAALDLLEPYGSDSRSTVVKELLAAWPFFDRRQYAAKVLRNFKGSYGGLRVDSTEAIEGLGELENLQKLMLSTQTLIGPEYVSELHGLRELRDFTVRTVGAFDLSNVSNMKKLQSLSVTASEILCFEQIGLLRSLANVDLLAPTLGSIKNVDLTHIHRLNLSGKLDAPSGSIMVGDKLNTLFATRAGGELGLTFLASANKITRLGLPMTMFMTALHMLPNLTGLRSAFLYECDTLGDLKFLSVIPELRALTIRGGSNLVDLRGLSNVPHLIELHLYNVDVLKSLDGIEACQGLVSFSINGREENIDVSALGRLPDLSKIAATPGVLREVKARGIATQHRPKMLAPLRRAFNA